MKIDDRLIEILNRYSLPTIQYGEMLSSVVKRSNDSGEVVIPVLGLQGMGKSTLLNGLLKANILPNDVDETTCVPVEIKYGENEYGEVIFSDGKPAVTVYTREDLNHYVDNMENPANKKRVSHIKLYRKADILKNNLTLVDLPGVGSVTLENEETTKRYIKNVATAIFLIPINPPIRKMEQLFIQGTWSQFSSAMFVQNKWDETPTEVKDGVDHNTKILRQLARQIGARINGDIIVVNAFDAVQGVLMHNDSQVKESNIAQLEERLKSFSANWVKNLAEELRNRAVSIINSALQVAESKLDEAYKTQEEQLNQQKARYEQFKAEAEAIIQVIDETEEWLSAENDSIRRQLKKLVTETVGYIRSEIYKKIEDGIFDGDKLEKAFNDVQSENVIVMHDKAIEILRTLAIDFHSKLNNLEDMLEVQGFNTFDPILHSTKRGDDWDSKIKTGGGILGGIGGAAVLLTNPGGWVVWGVGLAITAIVSGIAWLLGESIRDKKILEAKKSIREPIEQLESKLTTTMMDKASEFLNTASSILEKLREDQRNALRELRREAKGRKDILSTETIESDIALLKAAAKKYSQK